MDYDKGAFNHVSIHGDGNCLFYSVHQFLHLESSEKQVGAIKITEALGKTSEEMFSGGQQLKDLVIDWIRENQDVTTSYGLTPKLDIELMISDGGLPSNVKTFEDYLVTMQKSTNIYGGQLEITALSNVIGRNIRILYLRGNRYRNLSGYGYELDPGATDDIYLFHNTNQQSGTVGSNKHHFETLYPITRAVIVESVSHIVEENKRKEKENKEKTEKMIKERLNKQYTVLLNGLYDYYKDKEPGMETILSDLKSQWNPKTGQATEENIRFLLTATKYEYIPKEFQTIYGSKKYKTKKKKRNKKKKTKKRNKK